jgi:hypothetical protein
VICKKVTLLRMIFKIEDCEGDASNLVKEGFKLLSR